MGSPAFLLSLFVSIECCKGWCCHKDSQLLLGVGGRGKSNVQTVAMSQTSVYSSHQIRNCLFCIPVFLHVCVWGLWLMICACVVLDSVYTCCV